MAGSSQSQTLETMTYNSDEGQRRIVIWQDVCFYQSTGVNSGQGGTWFPTKGIQEQPLGMIILTGALKKPYYSGGGSSGAARNFPEDINKKLEEIFGYRSAMDLQNRFGSLPCMLLSSQLGGGLWDSAEGQQFKNILKEKFPDFYQQNSQPQLKTSQTTFTITKQQTSEENVNVAKGMNAWLKQRVVKPLQSSDIEIPIKLSELPGSMAQPLQAPMRPLQQIDPTARQLPSIPLQPVKPQIPLQQPPQTFSSRQAGLISLIGEHGSTASLIGSTGKVGTYIVFDNDLNRGMANQLINSMFPGGSRLAGQANTIAITPQVEQSLRKMGVAFSWSSPQLTSPPIVSFHDLHKAQIPSVPSNPQKPKDPIFQQLPPMFRQGQTFPSQMGIIPEKNEKIQMEKFLNDKKDLGSLKKNYNDLRTEHHNIVGQKSLHFAKMLSTSISNKGKARDRQLETIHQAFEILKNDNTRLPNQKAQIVYDLLSEIQKDVEKGGKEGNRLTSGMERLCDKYKKEISTIFPALAKSSIDSARVQQLSAFKQEIMPKVEKELQDKKVKKNH